FADFAGRKNVLSFEVPMTQNLLFQLMVCLLHHRPKQLNITIADYKMIRQTIDDVCVYVALYRSF
ncbi:MAG: hypothetical protein ACJ8BW_04005, partial [Ktedonobacteraceae bacterium]